MKVLLIGNYAGNEQESIQRYSDLLVRGLRDADCDVHLVHPTRITARKWLPDGLGKWLAYLDRFVLFLPKLRAELKWADIVHMTDTVNATLVSHVQSKPNVVTCHDMTSIRSALGELEHPTRWTGRIYQKWILRGLKRTNHIVCVSNQTRADVLRIVGCSAERVSVVHNAMNYPYSPMESTETEQWLGRLQLNPRTPFLLHVGDNGWNKNREGVIRIFSKLINSDKPYRGQLVLAGKPWSSSMRSLIRSLGLDGRISEIISPPNEGLRALYSRADAFLFPSLYEGFGWPIIEAQACGCLVITSNHAPMTEVGGDAAVYIDPSNERDASAKIMAVMKSDRSGLRVAGFRNVKRFDVTSMVEGCLKAYRVARGTRKSGET